jgi:hypothetical protein
MVDKKRFAELETENARLRAEIARLKILADIEEDAGTTARRVKTVRSVGAPRRALRDWTLDTLNRVGAPLFSQYLAVLHLCEFNRVLSPTRFGTLSVDERKRVESGHAPEIVLAHGLIEDGGTPVKRVWARSDWPFEVRVIAKNTSRVLFLKTALWVFEQAAGEGAGWAQFPGLKMFASQLARDVGADVRKKPDDFEMWYRLAEDELKAISAEDLEQRCVAAQRLQFLNKVEKLFGANPPLTVLPGTKEQTWKGSNR